MNVIIAIIIFGVLILFHEFGHFITAKRCGIRVNEFSLGFGPVLFGFTKGETRYCLKLLPLGGSCMMEGEDTVSDDPRAFNNKPLWQRFLVVLNGPMFNFIMAFVLSVILLANVGYDEPVLIGVMEGFPAEEAGLSEGDRIVSLNGYNIHFYNEISMYLFFHTGESINVTYERDGVKNTALLTPKYDEETGRYYLGMQGSGQRVKHGFFDTVIHSFYEIKYQIFTTFESLKMLVTGRVGLDDMSGPVGIVKTIGDTYEAAKPDGIFYVLMNLINITILLSANLGVMNLLPIPALDGGRILFMIVEAIRGKKLDEELEGKIHFAGFAILMIFMLMVMFSDITRIVG